MPIDFRREHQVAWARAEAARLRQSFGDAVVVVDHSEGGRLERGDRLLTISDPGGRGMAAAICVMDRSEEGSFWRVELRPISDDSVDIPETKAIQSESFEMRYNQCVHATWSREIGARSGADGTPDFAEGVGRMVAGSARVHRRHSLGAGRAAPYAAAALEGA